MNPLANRLLEGDIPDPDSPSVAPARSGDLTPEEREALVELVTEELIEWTRSLSQMKYFLREGSVEGALALYDAELLVRSLSKLDPDAAIGCRLTFEEIFADG
jgi:hypothetical protein